jgi:hypothetical protein
MSAARIFHAGELVSQQKVLLSTVASMLAAYGIWEVRNPLRAGPVHEVQKVCMGSYKTGHQSV